MTALSLPREVLDESVTLFVSVLVYFEEEIGDRPALGELLEILSYAVPLDSIEGPALPPSFTVKLENNRRYVGDFKSRVGGLSDATFVEASEWLSFLVQSISYTTDRQPTLNDVVQGLTLTFGASEIPLKDVRSNQIKTLVAKARKGATKPKKGDILAIPASGHGYHVAVVVDRNSFGTALGFFLGTRAYPDIDSMDKSNTLPYIIHTDDEMVANGTWLVLGRDTEKIRLFPEPEIYHRVNPQKPDASLGRYGAAESPGGVLRMIDEDEARRVGLLSNSYRQVHLSAQLVRFVEEV